MMNTLPIMNEQNDTNEQVKQQNIVKSNTRVSNERKTFIELLLTFVVAILMFAPALFTSTMYSDFSVILFVSGYTTGTYYVPCIIYLVYLCAIYGIVGPKPQLRKIYYIGITLFGVMGIAYIIWDLPYLLATYPPQVAPGAFDETTAIFSQLFAFLSVHGLLSGIYQIPPYLPTNFIAYRAVFEKDYANERKRPEIRWVERYFKAYFGIPDKSEKERLEATPKQKKWSLKEAEGRKNVMTVVIIIGVIAMWIYGVQNMRYGWIVYAGLTIISAIITMIIRIKKKQQAPESENSDIR